MLTIRSCARFRPFSTRHFSSRNSNRRQQRVAVVVAGSVVIAGAFVAVTSGRGSWVWYAVSDLAVSGMRLLDPERAHGLTIWGLSKGLGPLDMSCQGALAVDLWGRHFPSCIGMAAGFDKQAEVMTPLLEMGFGFVEVGGVTPQPQSGNPRPRMFRLLKDRALINRFGLNSEGHAVIKARLKAWRMERLSRNGAIEGVVGVNLAKNTGSPSAVADYAAGVREIGPEVDLVVLNVSCPNVKWTSTLGQGKGESIRQIIEAVQAELKLIAQKQGTAPALLLKLGPDMDAEARQQMASLVLETQVCGLIVSNTTSSRPASLQSDHATEGGGLSGAPLRDMALETLRDMYRLTGGQVPIIGCGGIASAEDAYVRIRSGATLVQLYTALVYEGPSLLPRIKAEVAQLLLADGFASVEEAVGVDVPLERPDSPLS